MANLINVTYTKNTYKAAKCRCKVTLVQGAKVLSVVKAQGSFNSISNYCDKCAEQVLKECMDEIMPLMQNIISIQEEIFNTNKIDAIYEEATTRFGSTLKKLED